MEQSGKSANELAQDRTDLAVYRTTLAASRSLMAWVRTGLSMIGFGFTAYKFIQSVPTVVRPNAARNIGLLLIGLGTLSVMFGWIEYWQSGRELSTRYNIVVRKFPLLMAGLIGGLGVLLFVGVLLRLS